MNIALHRWVWLALLAAATLAFSGLSGWADQGQGSGQEQKPPQGQQPPPKQPGQPTQPGQTAPAPAAPAVNAEEEAAYKTFFDVPSTEAQRLVDLGEEFLKKFPESKYRQGVYSRLTTAYLALGQEEKMFGAAEKALEINPENVDILALMALVLPRRVNPSALDAEPRLQKAEKYAKQGITLLDGMQKPVALTEDDFTKAKNEKLSMCHSGLGFVHFHRQKYADSATELEQATQLAANPDPADFFVLGLALQQSKRFADAATAFGRCGETPGQLQERCKQNADQAKKQAAAQPGAVKP